MFSFGGDSGKSTSFLGGGGGSSGGESIIPSFEDKSAFADLCPELTYQQRIIGFLSASAVGYVISLIGTLVLFSGFTSANITLFAVLYVIGNVISLVATGFLLGPAAQCRKMWLPTRRYSTAFYLSMIIIVFACGVSKQNVILILFLLFVQILASSWYTLSYVPFGRKIVLTFFRSLGICYPCFATSDAVQKCYKDTKASASSTMSGNSSASSNNKSSFFGGK